MPRKRLSMRNVNEVLRLFHMAGVSQNEIAEPSVLARQPSQKYIQRAKMQASRGPSPRA
jgi:DNA-binding transcriptional regulator LsrR (DeoR family)